jgi:hypothetical protein
VLDGAQRPGLLEHDAGGDGEGAGGLAVVVPAGLGALRPGDEPDVQPRIAGEAGPGAFGAVVGQQGRQVGVEGVAAGGLSQFRQLDRAAEVRGVEMR